MNALKQWKSPTLEEGGLRAELSFFRAGGEENERLLVIRLECFLQTQNKIKARTPMTITRTKQLKQNSSEDTPVA